MKSRLLITAAALVAFSGIVGTARAADIVAQDTAVDWSGLYVGAQIGFGDARMSGCVECSSSSAAFADDLNLSGLAGGLHAGYNWQSDALVFGLEGDVNLNNWTDNGATNSDDEFQKASINTLGSIRGRLGIAAGDALFYVTGGVALSDAKWTSSRDGNVDTAHFKDIGGVVGGGIELKAFEHASIRAEGLYYMFDDKRDISDFYESTDGENIKFKDAYVVRVGASWYFN